MTFFNAIVIAWIALALALLPIQLFVTAPYGRHVRTGWGPNLPNRLGWFAMEAVSLVLFAGLFLAGPAPRSAPMWIFFALWVAHYTNRSLIFPWRTKTRGKTIPLAIVLGAVSFNLVNAGLNGFYLGSLAHYSTTWLADPRFLIGLTIFIAGAATNIWADNKLIALRNGDTGYAIPHGGLFEFISCPNLFGEIVEWCGFALMCWNLPALSFAIWTAANLVPRALSHHAWYRGQFANYPKARRAVIPFLL
jgi:3-oxo-5-alpha-steroid 4-dehydrogenase 1